MGDDTFKKDVKKIKVTLKNHDKKFIEHEKIQDKFDLAIIALQEDIAVIKETMSTKDDIREVVQGNDKVIKMLTTLLEEKVFTDSRIARIDETQNIHSKDIQKLKLATGLA